MKWAIAGLKAMKVKEFTYYLVNMKLISFPKSFVSILKFTYYLVNMKFTVKAIQMT